MITLLVMLLMPTYIIMLAWHIGSVATHWSRLYRSADLIAVTDWLAQNASYVDGVLTASSSSMIIPPRAPVRVMVGHSSETIASADREAEVQRFFLPATSDNWRRALLENLNLDYVLFGPSERALGAYNPAQAPFLQLVFSTDAVQFYRVNP